jgi:Fe-S cluster assembly ATP-binding protein
MLKIENLHMSVGDKAILTGINLDVKPGEIHVIMGPNGAGKSTLGHALLANPDYTRTDGKIILDGEDLTALGSSERARKGLFLAFQYPLSIPGLKLSEYLRNLYSARHEKKVGVSEFRKILRKELEYLEIDKYAIQRYLNVGFSGGEMKRFEMLQLSLLSPKYAILDEIDSGVDVDAQKIIASSITRICKEKKTSFLIVTHYQRLLNFIEPTQVHVLMDGKIIKSGDSSLANKIEDFGYENFQKQSDSSPAL